MAESARLFAPREQSLTGTSGKARRYRCRHSLEASVLRCRLTRACSGLVCDCIKVSWSWEPRPRIPRLSRRKISALKSRALVSKRFILVALEFAAVPLCAQTVYRLARKEIAEALDAAPLPVPVLSPARDAMLLALFDVPVPGPPQQVLFDPSAQCACEDPGAAVCEDAQRAARVDSVICEHLGQRVEDELPRAVAVRLEWADRWVKSRPAATTVGAK